MATITERTHNTITGIPASLNYAGRDENLLQAIAGNMLHKPVTLRTTQLEKIKICNRFIHAFEGTGFFNKSFPAYSNAGNGFNRAASVLMSAGIKGSYPNMQLAYPKVMISKGNLPAAIYAAAAPMKDGNLFFSFTDNSETGSASSSDKIILVAYAERLNKAVFTLNAGLRKDCVAILETASLKGAVVETWISFLNNDETAASNSVYTGRHLLI